MEQQPDMGPDRQLSVSFIIGQLGLGGSEKQLYLLARELVLRRWRVTVLYLNSDNRDHWVQPLEQAGVTVFSPARAATQLERLKWITSLLKKEKPILVHSWSFYTNFYAALCGSLAGVPIRLGSERGNQEFSTRMYGRWRYMLSLVGLKALVTNSPVEAQSISNQKPALRVEVIPNGIDVDGLFCREKAREFMGISDECIVIGGMGSLTANKNFEYLISVTAKLTARFPGLRLVLIGDGPEKNKLLQRASNVMPDNRFMFLGPVPEAHRLLKGIDVLCISSLSEGMPNVILEAWGAGIPVVANKVGAVPSLVADGINGFVIDVGDECGFLGAMEKLVSDLTLCKAMGSAGERLVRSEYSSQRMADRFVSFYQEMSIINGNGNR